MCYNVFLNGSNVPNSDCNIHYLDRSFPSHKMFIEGTSEGKEGRATLFRVLAVYAMYNPQVSYCQGKPQPVVHFWASAIIITCICHTAKVNLRLFSTLSKFHILLALVIPSNLSF